MFISKSESESPVLVELPLSMLEMSKLALTSQSNLHFLALDSLDSSLSTALGVLDALERRNRFLASVF